MPSNDLFCNDSIWCVVGFALILLILFSVSWGWGYSSPSRGWTGSHNGT